MNRVTVGLIVLVWTIVACVIVGCSGDNDKFSNKRIIGTIASVQISGSRGQGKIIALTYVEGFIVVSNLRGNDRPIFYTGKKSCITIDCNGYIIESSKIVPVDALGPPSLSIP